MGEIKKQRYLVYLKLIFVKRSIQKILLSHYKGFNRNDLKDLEH